MRTDYHEARRAAEAYAKRLGRPVGLRAVCEFGRHGYTLGLLPRDPAKRQGWELRCEVVEPPASSPGAPRR